MNNNQNNNNQAPIPNYIENVDNYDSNYKESRFEQYQYKLDQFEEEMQQLVNSYYGPENVKHDTHSSE